MSNEHVLKTIEMVRGQIEKLDQEMIEKKRMVNDLCKLAGMSPIYADTSVTAQNGTIGFRSDEFYGKPLASVVRSILEKRAAAGMGAASVSEIYDAMVKGGYKFTAKSEDNAKRGLYISLAKNTSTFHKLPNGNYGLLSWYPAVKKDRGEFEQAVDRLVENEEQENAEGAHTEE